MNKEPECDKGNKKSQIFGDIASSIFEEIRDKYWNKFSILTEIEEKNPTLQAVRKFKDQRQKDEDSKPSEKQQLKSIEEYSVTNWYTTQQNQFLFR